MKLSVKTLEMLVIIFIMLVGISFGVYLGQLLIKHGHNYTEGKIFPGLPILLSVTALILKKTAEKKQKEESKSR